MPERAGRADLRRLGMPLGFLAFLCIQSGWLCGEEGPPAAEPPLLEAQPSPTGALTFWLVAAGDKTKTEAVTEAPAAPRAGQAAPGGGTWVARVFDNAFVNLKPCFQGQSAGTIWASARVFALSGGRRSISGSSYAALKVFLNGRQILNKPQPVDTRSDSVTAALELPAGWSTLTLAVGIRWGYSGFKLDVAAGEGGQAVPGDKLALPLEATATPDPAAALTQSVVFLTNSHFLSEAGTPSELALGFGGGWPGGIGAITPRFLGPDGTEFGGAQAARALDDIYAKPCRVAFAPPKDPLPFLELRCELLSGGKTLGVKTLRLYSIQGIRAAAGKLEQRMREAVARLGKPLPHTACALEKIGLWLESEPRPKEEVGVTLLELLESAAASLPAESEGRDPDQGRLGYFERAYTSAIDESPQPYFVHVPSAAKEHLAQGPKTATRFPLVLFLHGYVPGYHKHHWWTPMADFNAHFERLGAFLAIPFGRSNADFLGPGEGDVLNVVKEMQRLYPIDENRIYLYGYSMGGMGVYTLAAHFPSLWAAGVVLAGRADSPLLMNTAGIQTLHPFKQFLIRADQPIDLCENYLNIPMRIYHGQSDMIVNPREAQRMHDRMKELGCDVGLTLMPGDHWFGLDLMAEEAPVKWLLEQRRKSDPNTCRSKSYSLRFALVGQGRLIVKGLTGELQPWDLEWCQAGNEIQVLRCEGPLGLATWSDFTSKPLLLPKSAKGLVVSQPHKLGNLFDVSAWNGNWMPGPHVRPLIEGGWKFPFLCGPVKEATYGPFLLVYGTVGGEETARKLKPLAEKFAKEWYDFAKGRVAIKADTEVSAEEQKHKNLFLFGEEQENALLATAAATGKLPIRVKDGKAVIGDRETSLKDRGILFIYPNPLEGGAGWNSLVVVAGLPYGRYLPPNHKLDLIPDFLIYAAEKELDGTGTNKSVVAGFFDGKWRLSPETTWWFEEGR